MKAYSIITFDVEKMSYGEAIEKGVSKGNLDIAKEEQGFAIHSKTGISIWVTEETFRKHYLILDED